MRSVGLTPFDGLGDDGSVRDGPVPSFPGAVLQEWGALLLDGGVLHPVAAVDPDRAMLQLVREVRGQGLPRDVGGEVHAAAETLLEEHPCHTSLAGWLTQLSLWFGQR